MVKNDYLTRNRVTLIGYISGLDIKEVKKVVFEGEVPGEGFELSGILTISTSQGHWIDEDNFQEDSQLHTIELNTPWSVYCKRFNIGDLIGVEGRLMYRAGITKSAYIEVIDIFPLARPGITDFPKFSGSDTTFH